MTDRPYELPPLPRRPRVPAQRDGGSADTSAALHPPAGTRATAASDLGTLLRAHGTNNFADELAEISRLEVEQPEDYEATIRGIIRGIFADRTKLVGATSTDLARLYYLSGMHATELYLRVHALGIALNLAGGTPEGERDPELVIDVAIALTEAQVETGTEEGRRIALETLDRVAALLTVNETQATRIAEARTQITKTD